MNTQALEGKSNAELIAMLVASNEKLAQAKADSQRKLSLKVTSPKLDEETGKMKGTSGAISCYGLGKFPVTLFASQWESLITFIKSGAIDRFIVDNAAILSRKS